MALYTHHLPVWKRQEVEHPAAQLQQIRRNLRGSAKLKMTRNTLIEHAFQEIGGDMLKLGEHLSGHSAIIFTNENPFRLFKKLEKTKTKMAAKPGEKAPEDIVVAKGPTSFRPGPIVGELQQAGIPAAIEAGKVKIRETKRPMDVGLILQAAFFEGSVYEPSVLAIDEDLIISQMTLAGQQAFNLSVNAAIPTAETMAPIITRAVREARGLAIDASVYEKDVIDGIIGRAHRESAALQTLVGGSQTN